MSDWGMRWPKATRDKAVREGKCLVGFEATGKHLGKDDRLGTVGFAKAFDDKAAEALCVFMAALNAGSSPQEAHDKAWPAPIKATAG